MANTSAPFGFRQATGGGGGAPTFQQNEYKIASNNATAIFQNDAVVPVTGAATGYIKQATASTVALVGIFVSCKYMSTSQKRTVWSNYWPGSDATGDVTAYVIDDPNAEFIVQTNTTGIGFAKLMQYAQLVVGTGNTANGISGMQLNGTTATTVTFPFIVLALVDNPPGVNGSDSTTGFNFVRVGFNNQIRRSNGAGPVGIS